jgi:hypothetical protein
MKLLSSRFFWLFFWLAALPLSAGTIDVSQAVTVQLRPGDALVFDIPSWNYTLNAAAFSLPLYPTAINFVLISASDVSATFEARLQSSDGVFSEILGAPLSFSAGVLSSSAYSGPVSTMEGGFQLTTQNSQEIFGGPGEATLTLRNLGPAVVLGVPSNMPNTTLGQDLFVSLSGGPLAVGALHGAVLLQPSLAPVPEPRSGWLPIAGGLLLYLAAGHRKKFRINRLQSTQALWYHLGGSLESSPLKCRKSNQRSRIIN